MFFVSLVDVLKMLFTGSDPSWKKTPLDQCPDGTAEHGPVVPGWLDVATLRWVANDELAGAEWARKNVEYAEENRMSSAEAWRVRERRHRQRAGYLLSIASRIADR